jgi:phenylalanyl-tRNA synthetase beta chain
MLVKSEVTHAAVLAAIQSAAVKTLIKTELFDIYADDSLGAGLKSMAYTLTFQSREGTMTDEQINAAMTKISKKLTEQVEAQIR